MVNIGKSVVIKGELNGSEDLTIEGHVEGKIELKDHVLTIGPNGKIKAQVFAKAVIVLGEVNGNVTASEKVDIRDGGSVDGDIVSPRVAIAEGAHFRGSVDMQRKGGSRPQAQTPKPASQPHVAGPGAAASRRALTQRRSRSDCGVRRAMARSPPPTPISDVDHHVGGALRSVLPPRKDDAEADTGAIRCARAPDQSAGAFLASLSARTAAGAARSRPGRRVAT